MIAGEETTASDVQQLNIEMNANEKNGYKCQASSVGEGRNAWLAFNYGAGTTSKDNGESGIGSSKGAWIGYYFKEPVCVTKFEFANPEDGGCGTPSNFGLQGSNSENGEGINIQKYSGLASGTKHSLNVNNSNYYLYYRLQFDDYNNNWSDKTARVSWLKYFGTKKIVKKYEVKKVYYRNNPMKKIVVGTNKVIYQRETGKYKTGNLVKMTSANTPSPFEAYGGESYINFHEPGESYNWDRTGGTWNYFVSPILNTNQKIIPVSINVRSGSNTALGSQMGHFYGSNNGSSGTELGSAQTGNIGGGGGTKEITIHTGLNTNNCQGYQYFKVGPDGHPFGNVQVNNLNIRITEGYIKSK